MTTRTIPEYLEDERQKHSDDRLRMEKEAERIRALPHGHHRAAKQPDLELASPDGAPGKMRKTAAIVRKEPRAARKTALKDSRVA
jgi:hypothetical protein